MLSFRSFIVEKVNRTALTNLRKEAQMFSKNIRRIKNGHDLYVVVQAYAKWLKLLNKTAFSQLIGMNDSWHDMPQNESYPTQQLRIKMWALVSEQSIFMPRISWHLNKQDDIQATNTGEEYAVYRYNDVTKSAWDAYYAEFDRTRNSIYAKYGKLVREAFDALDEWLAEQPDAMTSHHDTVTMKHDGVVVVFSTSETRDPKGDHQEQKKYLDALSFVLKRYRQLGFRNVVDKLIFEYDRADNKATNAGEYRFGRIMSFSWSGNSPHTIAHEIAHHIFRVSLTEKQQKAWLDYVERDLVSFSAEDYDEIRRVFLALWKEMGRQQSSEYAVSGVWENVSKHLTSPVTKQLYDAYSNQRNHVHMSVMKNDPEGSFDEFKSDTKKPFLLHAPTSYSSKNGEEAYCEVFGFYINSKRLEPITKHQFETLHGFGA